MPSTRGKTSALRTQRPALAVAPAQQPPADKSRHLEMVQRPGQTRERLLTDVLAQGLATNAMTAARFAKREYGEVSLTDMVASLRESGDAINRNDTAEAERLLYSQTVALNAMFCELARVAHANMFTNLDAMDRYMRLALKAQSQSRMTVETLAAMKNPPVVFARQANFASGPQQVNNGTHAHAQEKPIPQAELLGQQHGQWMDTGAASKASTAHQDVETVGALDRTAQRRGKGRRVA